MKGTENVHQQYDQQEVSLHGTEFLLVSMVVVSLYGAQFLVVCSFVFAC